jgi:protein-disulfide isomerase
MTQDVKVIVGIAIATLAILGGIIFFGGHSGTKPTGPASEKLLIRDNSNKISADGAKVTIVEFGDYQCPACGAVYPTLKQVLNDYKGKINFVFRNYPLPQHPNALIAAEAAEAAGDQGKYWEMHDKLYDNQNAWAEESKPIDIFVGYARDLSLDANKFKSDVESNKFADKITSDQQDGNDLGVNSTPTIYINGKTLDGVPDYNTIKSKIDELNK